MSDIAEGLITLANNEDWNFDRLVRAKLIRAATEIFRLREEVGRLMGYETECPSCAVLMDELKRRGGWSLPPEVVKLISREDK